MTPSLPSAWAVSFSVTTSSTSPVSPTWIAMAPPLLPDRGRPVNRRRDSSGRPEDEPQAEDDHDDAGAEARVVAGVLADRLGPGRVVRAGLVLSLFCFAGYALVSSFEMLLVLRVLQGMSGGLIYGAAPALVTLSLPPSRHGWGLGWASTGLGLGLSVSPLIGGVIVGSLGWRGTFLYPVPVTAALIVLAAWTPVPGAGSHV